MFKEILRENKIYEDAKERIMCRIEKNNIEINIARKFKTMTLQMFRNDENLIVFIVKRESRRKFETRHNIDIANQD